MSTTFKDASWDVIQALRGDLQTSLGDARSLEAGARDFVQLFARSFDTTALARMFVVCPFEKLPRVEQQAARETLGGLGRPTVIAATTPS